MRARQLQSDSQAVPTTVATTTRRNRRVVLSLVFLFVAALGLAQRGDDLRAWWLNRKPLEALRVQNRSVPDDPLVGYIYGQKLLVNGQADAALSTFQQAVRALPHGANSTLAEKLNAHAGYLLARQGESSDALACLDRAHSLDDEDPLVAVAYGILFAAQNKTDFAITQFRLASTLDSRNAEAWFRLGSALLAAGQAKDAAGALRQAVKLVPRDAASHAELGRALAAQNQPEAAGEEYRSAHNLAPANTEVAVLLATTLSQSARSRPQYQEAAALLSAAYKQYPNDASLATTLGALHLRFDAPALAKTYLERAVTLAPREAQGWYNLARAQQLLHNPDAAARSQARFHALDTLASEISIATKHVAAAPNDASWRLRLATLYIQQESLEAARAQYAIALGLQPDNAAAKRAFDDLSLRLHRQAPATPGEAAVTLGPPPPPGLQVYDPKHELPAFHAESATLPTPKP